MTSKVLHFSKPTQPRESVPNIVDAGPNETLGHWDVNNSTETRPVVHKKPSEKVYQFTVVNDDSHQSQADAKKFENSKAYAQIKMTPIVRVNFPQTNSVYRCLIVKMWTSMRGMSMG